MLLELMAFSVVRSIDTIKLLPNLIVPKAGRRTFLIHVPEKLVRCFDWNEECWVEYFQTQQLVCSIKLEDCCLALYFCVISLSAYISMSF